jgi:benzodiazapine receptor
MRIIINIIGLAVFLALPALAAWIGGMATASSVGSWYQELAKPEWTPPGSVIGAVWGILYPAMGIAAWLVWLQRDRTRVSEPLLLWAIHLPFNALWSVCFFGLRSPGLALLEIVVLWGIIAVTTAAFFTRSPLAGALMLPYVLWVAFAGFLNLSIWWMNL